MNKKIFFIGLLGLGLAAAGLVVWFFVAFYISMERGEEHRRQLQAEQRSGKWDFGDQPALFAVVHAIVKNDQEVIRAAAKASRPVQRPRQERSPGQLRLQMLRDPQPKALPRATSSLPWRRCAQVWHMPTCIRRTSAEVKFAARSTRETGETAIEIDARQ